MFIFFIKSKWFLWTIWLYVKSQHVYRVMRVTIRTVITTLPEPHPAKRLSRCTSVIKHCNNNTPHFSHLCIRAHAFASILRFDHIYYCYTVTVFAPTVCMVGLGKSLPKWKAVVEPQMKCKQRLHEGLDSPLSQQQKKEGKKTFHTAWCLCVLCNQNCKRCANKHTERPLALQL